MYLVDLEVRLGAQLKGKASERKGKKKRKKKKEKGKRKKEKKECAMQVPEVAQVRHVRTLL